MASQNKIIEMIGSIKTIYPYYAKETDVEVLVKTWTVLLKNYTDDQVEAAFYKALQVCKMPPTPADVIEQINAMQEATQQPDEELWGVLVKSLREVDKFIYRITYPKFGENPRAEIDKQWEQLPDRLKQYVGSRGELMRMAKEHTEEGLKFEKTRFLKTMPTIKKREEYSEYVLLVGEERKLIGGGHD